MRIYENRAYGPDPIANNYWDETVERPQYFTLEGHVVCDTAIIGGGYTGLNAALELVRAGQDVVVLDANYPGFGASGRNGGFCCLGGSKIAPEVLSRRVGNEDAIAYFRAEMEAVSFVESRLEALKIDADIHSKGETLLAHSARAAAAMQQQATASEDLFGVPSEFLPRDALAENGMGSDAFFGALTTPIGFALNPMKYLQGLAAAVSDVGARIFGNSSVNAIASDAQGAHVLETGKGRLTARNLLVATNGYSSENVPKWLAGRYLPVQSAIAVTRPMSEEELASQGWTSRQMCYDTRNLLHYFRLMPNNRMLFGMRGGAKGTVQSSNAAKDRIRADFDRFFPAWRHVETTHYWSGLVCMARRLTPFAGPIPGLENAWAALCFHGNGVAMGSYAGSLVARQVLGKGGPAPSVMTHPLSRFELGRYRRALLPLVLAWYGFRDKT